MKNNTFNKIITLIRAWKIPVIKDLDWKYRACIFEKDWKVFVTTFDENIEWIYNQNWICWREDEIRKNEWKIIRIDERNKNEYKDWDLVDLDIEALEKTIDWNILKHKYESGTKWLKIDYTKNELDAVIKVYNLENDNYLWIAKEYILPHIKEEKIITIDWKDIKLSEESFNELKRQLCQE